MTAFSERAANDGQPATEIQVREGRLLLFWPLALHLTEPVRGAAEIAAAVRAVAERLCDKGGVWQRVSDPIQHIASPEDDGLSLKHWENEAYAEAVYFHEFVQSFLFRNQGGGGPFYLFRRTDIGAARITFAGVEKTLAVERLNLYLFRTGAAIVVLELHAAPTGSGSSGWTLSEFQDFHDHFRRVYAPFFDARGGCFKVAEEVAWLASSEDNKPLIQCNLDGVSENGAWNAADAAGDVRKFILGSRIPPVFGHWRFLLASALAFPGKDPPPGEGHWHQVVDERMLSMATVSLTPARDGEPVWKALGDERAEEASSHALAAFNAVRLADLMRLCFADDQGDGVLPAETSPSIKNFFLDHAYTRFRSAGTLFLLSGYAFVAIGAGRKFDESVMGHVRRHYFQMGLLAHFELASLLTFSSQISHAIKRLDDSNNQPLFQIEMSGIEEQFLQFVHRFRFTGVSNQLQAQEIFAKWRKLSGIDSLFQDVASEVHTANQYLATRAQTRLSFAATRLSQVAAVGVFVGLAFSMLGMNVVFTDRHVGDYDLMTHVAIGIGTAGTFMLIGGAVFQVLSSGDLTYWRSSQKKYRPPAHFKAWPRGRRLSRSVEWDPFAVLLFGIGVAAVLSALLILAIERAVQ